MTQEQANELRARLVALGPEPSRHDLAVLLEAMLVALGARDEDDE